MQPIFPYRISNIADNCLPGGRLVLPIVLDFSTAEFQDVNGNYYFDVSIPSIYSVRILSAIKSMYVQWTAKPTLSIVGQPLLVRVNDTRHSLCIGDNNLSNDPTVCGYYSLYTSEYSTIRFYTANNNGVAKILLANFEFKKNLTWDALNNYYPAPQIPGQSLAIALPQSVQYGTDNPADGSAHANLSYAILQRVKNVVSSAEWGNFHIPGGAGIVGTINQIVGYQRISAYALTGFNIFSWLGFGANLFNYTNFGGGSASIANFNPPQSFPPTWFNASVILPNAQFGAVTFDNLIKLQMNFNLANTGGFNLPYSPAQTATMTTPFIAIYYTP